MSDISGSESSDSGEAKKLTRKRVKRPETWEKTLVKVKRNSGEAYKSRSTKKDVGAKVVGVPCTCVAKCFDAVGRANIQTIFDNYYALPDHDAKSRYLVSRVVNVEKKRTYVRGGAQSRRTTSRQYSVLVNNKPISVCMVAFLHIHAISESRVRQVLAKLTSTGTISQDQRGRHEPANKTTEEQRQAVKAHIDSLPTCTSHYSRAKSRDRKYLPPGSSKSSLYRDYEYYVVKENLTAVKVSAFIYNHIFETEYNIGVEPPRSDSCALCDRVKNEISHLKASSSSDDNLIRRKETELRYHLARAKAAHEIRKVYEQDQDSTVAAIAIDLQQTLATPRIATGVQYYARKLWTYNFGIHDLKTGAAIFCVWNETQGKRGSCEVASCLLKYIEQFLDDNIRHLIVFSDNCAGQNKNMNLVLFYLRFIHSGRFDSVEHFYLISGHSFLPCDRDFGHLEKFVSPLEVYSTPQYKELMKSCRAKNPIQVIDIDSTMIYNWEVLQKCITKGGVAGKGFQDGRVFVISKDYKLGMEIKSFFVEGTEGTFVKLQKGKGKEYNPATFDLSSVHVPLKFPGGVLVKPDKLSDVRKLLHYIPPAHTPFYDAIFKQQDELRESRGVVGGAAGSPDDSDSDPDSDTLDY